MTDTVAKHLWAKSNPHHFLWRHLLDVASVAHALIARFGPIDGLPPGWIEFLAGTHDVGKADPWFQNKDSALALALIDLGLNIPKWTPDSETLSRYRHEARSAEWLRSRLPQRHGWDKKAANVAAKAIIGHHGQWDPDCYSTRQDPHREAWSQMRDELGDLLWDVIRPEPAAVTTFPNAGAAGVKLAAYVILSDWIASNDELFPYTTLQHLDDPAEYFEAACQLATDVVHQMGLDAPEPEPEAAKPAFRAVRPKIERLRPLQEELDLRRETLPPGLAIIEAPMGEGKTEAALYLAQVWAAGCTVRGVYFGLPTQATANSIHARYSKFLADWRPSRRARLLHGMAWLRDDPTPQAAETLPQLDAQNNRELSLRQARNARDWFRPMRRALLASEGVGTIDQALMAGLRVKFGPLRLLGLSQKTLILDEVHACDQFMGVLLEALLRWCRALEINVILLSATLSRHQKLALARAYAGEATDLTELESTEPEKVPYPLLTFVPRSAPAFTVEVGADPDRVRTIELDLQPGMLDDSDAIAGYAAALVARGGCACILVNTVKAAQDVYRHLEQMLEEHQLPPNCELDLFHARFRVEERAKIESRVVGKFGPDAGTEGNVLRPSCSILVATQVVEQSLDVDFDFLVSQIAPIDLLLQRIGRLWRHQRAGRTGNPVLTVLLPPDGVFEFGNSGVVYSVEILLRTLAILHTKTPPETALSWRLPRDFRPLIETCYRREARLGELAGHTGFADRLSKAEEQQDTETHQARSDAQIHVWIEPKADSFQPVKRAAEEADEDSDAKAEKYFIAQTRRGNESLNLLPLCSPDLRELVQQDAANADLPRDRQFKPRRTQLAAIFNQKVGVPAWWFKDIQPAPGFAPPCKGQSFLRGHTILLMQEREGERFWRGHDAKGEFEIIDHATLGLMRHPLNASAPIEEADAGYTGS